MYSHWDANLLVVLVTAATLAFAVLLHYEGLHWLSTQLTRHAGIRRRKVLLGVYGVILLHVAEIWVFGFSIWGLLFFPNAGAISGAHAAGLLDVQQIAAQGQREELVRAERGVVAFGTVQHVVQVAGLVVPVAAAE